MIFSFIMRYSAVLWVVIEWDVFLHCHHSLAGHFDCGVSKSTACISTAECRWNPINSRELQAEMKRRNVSYEELVPCVPVGSTLPRVPCSLHDGKEIRSYSVSSPDFPALPPAAAGL